MTRSILAASSALAVVFAASGAWAAGQDAVPPGQEVMAEAAPASLTAGVLAYLGRARLGRERHMPLTVDTVKESMQWMRARTP